MLPTTETWRHCASLVDEASESALRDVAIAAIETIITTETASHALPDKSTACADVVLLNALVFVFRFVAAHGAEEAEAVCALLVRGRGAVSLRAARVLAEVWTARERDAFGALRFGAVRAFCGSPAAPPLLSAFSRVVTAEGGDAQNAACDGMHRVESFLAFPSAPESADGAEAVMSHDEAYAFFCELDAVQSKLDDLLLRGK